MTREACSQRKNVPLVSPKQSQEFSLVRLLRQFYFLRRWSMKEVILLVNVAAQIAPDGGVFPPLEEISHDTRPAVVSIAGIARRNWHEPNA